MVLDRLRGEQALQAGSGAEAPAHVLRGHNRPLLSALTGSGRASATARVDDSEPAPHRGARPGARRYSAFTRASSCPAPSTVWMAQARHGSNECTVRSASSGSFGSAMGLPTSEASYGPGRSA